MTGNDTPGTFGNLKQRALGAPPRNGTIGLTDEQLRFKFPQNDYDAIWLFGAIRGNDRFKAIKVGVNVGTFDGYDWGMKDIVPDPNVCFFNITLIGDDEALIRNEYPARGDFQYDHQRLDVALDDRLRIVGEWPHMYWRLSSGGVTVEFEARMSVAHWYPDFVLKGTSLAAVAIPDFEYSGTITIDGETTPFTGIGTIDRPSGRVFQSPTSKRVGYWQWDGIMLDDAFGLCQWKIVDGQGADAVLTGVTTYPDGAYHPGVLAIDYVSFEDRGGVPLPREMACRLSCDHGQLEYTVRGLGQAYDGTPHERGTVLPNLLYAVDGTFHPADGGASRSFSGRGTGELILSEWNPQTNSKQTPW